MDKPSRWGSVDTSIYDKKWAEMAKAGHDPHGEVAFIQRFDPTTVLDAGCGTGRVAIELANRGIDAMGTDVDDTMLAAAREKAPELDWALADLASLDLRTAAGEQRRFDVVAMPGNVMIFVATGTEGAVLQRCADHLEPEGLLIAGFQLGRGLDPETYDRLATAAGLWPVGRFATWDGDPWVAGGGYLVAVHRLNP